MKLDTKWIRRSAVLVLGACFVVGMTGCLDDDDKDDLIPNFWAVEWTGDDAGSITLPYTGDDLRDIPNIDETAAGYRVVILVTGSEIDIEIEDVSGNSDFELELEGTIHDATSATGTYSGYAADGVTEIVGTWVIREQ